MTRALSPRSVALTDQILAMLEAEAPLPVSTGHIHGKICPMPAGITARRRFIDSGRYVNYGTVYGLLNRLARSGDVEKWAPDEHRRSCLWRRLTFTGGGR